MHAFAFLLLPAFALANIDAGGSQDPPTIPGTVLTTINNNTTSLNPISTTAAPGNLSITNTAATTPAGGASGSSSPTQSVVLVTTSLPGSGLETITSFVPGATGGSGSGNPSASPSGSTQPGAAVKLGSGGALGALVVAVGVGAMFL